MSIKDDLCKILISEEEIQAKITEVAKVLEKDYKDKNPLFLCILKGSIPFFADLIKRLDMPMEIDCMSISSYGNKTTSGEVRLLKDLDKTIAGRHIVIVEDIVDSGRTLYYLKNLLNQRHPASVKVCTLLNKQSRREVDINAEYIAFEVPDEFVVGYGLDFAEQYRNLPFIGVLSPGIYEKS